MLLILDSSYEHTKIMINSINLNTYLRGLCDLLTDEANKWQK